MIASSLPGLTPTLALADSGDATLCPVPEGSLGFAVEVDLRTCDAPACFDAVRSTLERGATLVLFNAPNDGPAHLPAQLAEGVAELTDAGDTLLHAAVPSPLELHRPEFWRAALEGELLRWPEHQPAPHRLLLSDSVARGLGRRGLLKLGGDRPLPASLALLGLHFAAGGSVELQEGADPKLIQAAAMAQAHPELFGRHRAPVSLVVPVLRLLDPNTGPELDARLVGLTRLLTTAGHAIEPILIGEHPLLPVRFHPERLGRAALIVVPGHDALTDSEWSAVAEGGQSSPILILDDEAPTELPSPLGGPPIQGRSVGEPGTLAAIGKGERSEVVHRWRRRLDQEDEQLTDNARRADGAIARSSLPPSVLRIPAWSPEEGVFAQHLIDLGHLDGTGAAALRGDLSLDLPIHAARHFGACAAVLHQPARDRSIPGECETAVDRNTVRVRFLGQGELDPWSIVEVRLTPQDRPELFGKEPIRLPPSSDTWLAPTVNFDVPFLDERQALSLSLPEFVRVENPPEGFDGNINSWSTSGAVEESGRRGRFRAEAHGLVFEADLRTEEDGVDVSITIANTSEHDLGDVEILLCASSRGASPFPEAGHSRTWIDTPTGRQTLDELPIDRGDPLYIYRSDLAKPLVAVDSMDGRWRFGHAFDQSSAGGGNGSNNGVCLHSKPQFGRLGPGESATREGRLFLGRTGELNVPGGWTPGGVEARGEGPGIKRMPCVNKAP